MTAYDDEGYIDIRSWWPPKVGDKLRHHTVHSAGGMKIKNVDALLHIEAIFEHDGGVRIVTAEWFPGRKRWNYHVWDGFQARLGTIWPDGQDRPEWPRPKPTPAPDTSWPPGLPRSAP